MKTLILFFSAALMLHITANAQCDCDALSGVEPGNKTLVANTCYELSGCYTITEGHTLTIPAGTKIFADANSMLYIQRGATILANGTSQAPIVFTSNQSPNSRAAGDWGGIVVAGYAPNNKDNLIELDRVCDVEAGGETSNDNSGDIEFVQIHYATNGLSLVSVGSGTEVHDVQISHSSNDGFQFMGGTVDAANLVSWNAYGKDFYFTDGYNGEQQFLLSYREDEDAHISGAAGLVAENDISGSADAPVTKAVISNYTSIGPRFCNAGTLDNDFTHAVLLRGNTYTSVYNSILSHWRVNGVYLADDATTIANTASDDLNFSYNTFSDNLAGGAGSDLWLSGCEADVNEWLATTSMFPPSCIETNNQFSPSVLGFSAMNICGSVNPDFTRSGSSTVASATFPMSGDLSNGFFDPVSYRGAVGSTSFTTGWTEWQPQTRNYCGARRMSDAGSDSKGLTLVPNPALHTTQLVFVSAAKSKAEIRLIDRLTNKTVRTQQVTLRGMQERIDFDLSGILAGNYIMVIETGDGLSLSQQLVKE